MPCDSDDRAAFCPPELLDEDEDEDEDDDPEPDEDWLLITSPSAFLAELKNEFSAWAGTAANTMPAVKKAAPATRAILRDNNIIQGSPANKNETPIVCHKSSRPNYVCKTNPRHQFILRCRGFKMIVATRRNRSLIDQFNLFAI
jgi:hypothetical protein